MSNPCLRCGACCAYYRVSFYWAEADDVQGGTVPNAMTVQVTPMQRAMRGTENSKPRCCALQGEVGSEVSCSIYSMRGSPCREFSASWENNAKDERCDKARLAWGLLPLQPGDLIVDPLAI